MARLRVGAIATCVGLAARAPPGQAGGGLAQRTASRSGGVREACTHSGELSTTASVSIGQEARRRQAGGYQEKGGTSKGHQRLSPSKTPGENACKHNFAIIRGAADGKARSERRRTRLLSPPADAARAALGSGGWKAASTLFRRRLLHFQSSGRFAKGLSQSSKPPTAGASKRFAHYQWQRSSRCPDAFYTATLRARLGQGKCLPTA